MRQRERNSCGKIAIDQTLESFAIAFIKRYIYLIVRINLRRKHFVVDLTVICAFVFKKDIQCEDPYVISTTDLSPQERG